MNTTLFSRIELHFWNFAIQTLSRSGFTRYCLRRAYSVSHNAQTASMGMLVGGAGLAGLVSGCLFYVVTSGGLR